MRVKQVTIKDIAQRLGISHSTVSRALSSSAAYLVNEKTRMLVKQTADEMQYTPNLMAQGFVTGKTGTLGLLTYQISLETYGNQTGQVLRAAENRHYQLLMGMAVNRTARSSQDDQRTQIRQLISRGVDGLLINTRGDRGESDRIIEVVRNRIPVVTYHYPTDHISGVVLDLETDFYQATNYLIELGHRRIGFIGRAMDTESPVSSKGRGYFRAMRDNDLPHEIIPPLGIRGEGGYIQGQNLRDRFTALVCRDDYTAIGVCRGLHEAGLRIPEDVAVVGFGDIDVSAYLSPALTTMAVPYEEIARSALELLLRKIGGEDTMDRVTLRSRLVIRESCGGYRD